MEVNKQIINYNDTYSPVVRWFSIRLLIVISLLNNWNTRNFDFFLAFPDVTIKFYRYMKLPVGTVLAEDSSDTHILLLQKNFIDRNRLVDSRMRTSTRASQI